MKKILITTGFLITAIISFAQSNNPYNQKGVDYVSSMKLISGDYDAGKVKDFSLEALDYYSKMIPLQTQTKASLEMISVITKGIKSPQFNLVNAIETSSLSEFSKTMLKEIWKMQNTPTVLMDLTAKIETINKANISKSEKEDLLSLVAITYNVNKEKLNGGAFASRYPNPVGLTAGAFFGFIIGGVFGPGGAVIGMLVGGLVGGLSK